MSYHLIILQFRGSGLEILPATLALSSITFSAIYLVTLQVLRRKIQIGQFGSGVYSHQSAVNRGQAHIEEGPAPGYEQLH